MSAKQNTARTSASPRARHSRSRGLLAILFTGALLAGCAATNSYPDAGAPTEWPQDEAPRIIWSDPPQRTGIPDIIWREPPPDANTNRILNYRMARNVEQMVGAPYRWGGTTPAGFDCSGLVYYAYRQLGITPPRTTWDQYQSSRPVNRAALVAGDLLFFRLDGRRVSHVGIYLGQNRFVHAPATGKNVTYDNLNAPFWRQRFLRAGRLFSG